MLTQAEIERYQDGTCELIRRAGIHVTDRERRDVEVADFGLGDFETTGLGILVYVNTDRCCAKELAMWPGQTCPEHRHPTVGSDPGKEETFRCRWGTVYLYVPGEPSETRHAEPPAAHDGAYTVWHEVVLHPGDQYTLKPNTKHWFQAGENGAVISEFSTRSTDQNDIFTDQAIVRATKVVER